MNAGGKEGTFGENLTLSSFGTEPVRIGDRFKVGAALLERLLASPLAERARVDVERKLARAPA